MANILVVDDETDIRELVKDILADEGFTVKVAENGTVANDIVRQWKPDLAFVDIWMPDIDGITLLNQWVESGLLTYPVIIMSGHGTIDTAIEATRLGAFDYVEKPLSMTKLLQTVERALASQKTPATTSEHTFSLIGKSPEVERVRQSIESFGRAGQPVVFCGEVGVGKSLCARLLAGEQPNGNGNVREWTLSTHGEAESQQLLAALNAPVPGMLLIKQLELLDNQLQKVLASWLVEHQGSVAASKICFTVNDSLAALHGKGKITDRLLSILEPFQCVVPALRDRLEDVPDLVRYFVDYFAEAEQLPYRKFSVASQNLLRNQLWPGNVRQLQLFVKRVMLESTKEILELDDVQYFLSSADELLYTNNTNDHAVDINLDLSLRDARELFERQYLEMQLKACGGNVASAAKKAGMERTHLYRKIRQLGLDIRDK